VAYAVDRWALALHSSETLARTGEPRLLFAALLVILDDVADSGAPLVVLERAIDAASGAAVAESDACTALITDIRGRLDGLLDSLAGPGVVRAALELDWRQSLQGTRYAALVRRWPALHTLAESQTLIPLHDRHVRLHRRRPAPARRRSGHDRADPRGSMARTGGDGDRQHAGHLAP
jgi:hypothetical protein